MSELGHDLASEFPDARELLHRLKIEDDEFKALSQDHHVLTQSIYRIEAGLDAASDDRLEDLKKRRLKLLDLIAEKIAEKRAA